MFIETIVRRGHRTKNQGGASGTRTCTKEKREDLLTRSGFTSLGTPRIDSVIIDEWSCPQSVPHAFSVMIWAGSSLDSKNQIILAILHTPIFDLCQLVRAAQKDRIVLALSLPHGTQQRFGFIKIPTGECCCWLVRIHRRGNSYFFWGSLSLTIRWSAVRLRGNRFALSDQHAANEKEIVILIVLYKKIAISSSKVCWQWWSTPLLTPREKNVLVVFPERNSTNVDIVMLTHPISLQCYYWISMPFQIEQFSFLELKSAERTYASNIILARIQLYCLDFELLFPRSLCLARQAAFLTCAWLKITSALSNDDILRDAQ